MIGAGRVFGLPTDDMRLDWDEICNKYGFVHSTHTVTTDDGYILTLMRISGMTSESVDEQQGVGKPPILFQHGLTDSSDAWLCHTPDKAPAFVAV